MPSAADARTLFSALAVERYGKPATKVANLLCKNPGSVSRWLAKARTWLDEPGAGGQLDSIDRYIVSEYSGARPIDDLR